MGRWGSGKELLMIVVYHVVVWHLGIVWLGGGYRRHGVALVKVTRGHRFRVEQCLAIFGFKQGALDITRSCGFPPNGSSVRRWYCVRERFKFMTNDKPLLYWRSQGLL